MFESDDVLMLEPDQFSWEICSLLYMIWIGELYKLLLFLDGNLENSKFIFDFFEGWKWRRGGYELMRWLSTD